MTTVQFLGAWDEAMSHLRYTARAADTVTDLDANARTSLRRALEVAMDMLDLARKSNRLAIMGATEHPPKS